MSETESVNTDTATEVVTEAQEANVPETFDREYVENLRKEAAKHRTEAKAKADRLADIEAKYNALTEETGTKEAAANAAIEKANLDITRLRTAQKYGISFEDSEVLLTGTTEEDLEKQAEALSKRSGHSVQPDPAQGNRDGTGPKGPKAAFDAWFDNK